jgi:hypothetical protein
MFRGIGHGFRRGYWPLGIGVCLLAAASTLPTPPVPSPDVHPDRIVPGWHSGGSRAEMAMDRPFEGQDDDPLREEPEVGVESQPDPLSSNPAFRPAPSARRSETFLDRLRGRPPPRPLSV